MPCPSCGKDDHARSSSSKCLNRKRCIRETDLDSDQEVSVYNVKKSLTSVLCPLNDCKEAIVCAIRDDVREMSRLSIELSYLVNFFYKHYSTRDDFHLLLPKFDVLQFTYALKGAKHKLTDPDNVISTYTSLRRNNTFYDGRLKSFTIMQIAKQYSTILETNIQTHAFKRLKRYMYHKFGTDMDKSEVHSSTYEAYYNGMCKSNRIGEWFTENKINSKELKKDFWKFIPLFLRIQHELYENNKPSFNVFPIYSHGLKFITYDSRCIHELLKRVDPNNTPNWSVFSENTTIYWNRHFTLPRKFGYSFSTDGVSVCLSMNRIIQKGQKFKSKKVKRSEESIENTAVGNKRNYSKVIAVDPGAKTPIITCTRNGDEFSYKVLKKERVVYESKECHRVRKRLRFIKDIEERIRVGRESFEKETGIELTRKSKNVEIHTRFQLKWFDGKQKLYEQRRFQRLKFDKYINDQKMLHKIVDEYFGKEPDTLVVYGAGFDFMNKGTFKGHRKFRHNDILKIIKQRKNLSLYIINEAFTTKNCSKCYEKKIQQKLHVSKSPHRYVYCSVCRKGIHRDKNGAKNILLKFEYKLSSIPSFADTDMNSMRKLIRFIIVTLNLTGWQIKG